MSDFSFSYEKHKNTYIINASLKNHGIGIRILIDENGWMSTPTFSSDHPIHPIKNEIRRCLIQYVLHEISQNKPLKDDLMQLTNTPSTYQRVIEHSSDTPCTFFIELEPASFTETTSELVLTCKVCFGMVEEVVKVVYHVTKDGHKQVRLLREDAFKQLEEEGFPFHPLTDEQILTSLDEDKTIQCHIFEYVAFSKHLLALKQPSSTYSFTVTSYKKKKHNNQEFTVKVNNSPIYLRAIFIDDQLDTFYFEMNTWDWRLSHSSDKTTFPSLYNDLYEFITKKSKYRIKFLF
jgi:hypothetical protein